MTRISTIKADWPLNQAVPALPTGAVDENGNAIMYPPINFGSGADEFPLPEGGDPNTHNYGRTYTEEGRLNEVQLTYLSAQVGITITRAGTFAAPEWPFPVDPI